MFDTRRGFSLPVSNGTDERAQNPMSLKFSLQRPAPISSAGAPFASITFGNLGIPDGNKRREVHTGVLFPLEYCHRTKTNCPDLAGLGVRSKKLLGIKNINVYALGIYVDTTAAKKVLSSAYKNQRAPQLYHSQPLIDDVLRSDAIDKTLRLVISFGALKRSQFVAALEERLAPRLKKEGDEAALVRFKAQFDGVAFEKGTEVVFCQTGKGTLVTKVAGSERGVIESAALCRSLFDVYLGTDPVSAEAKNTFARNLADVVAPA